MMSKQTAIILILTVFIGTLGALLWFYFNLGSTPDVITPTQTTEDIYDPFGTQTDILDETDSDSTEETDQNLTDNTDIPDALRKISEDPISGFSVVENKKTNQTNIHYILRANGNIYEAYTDSLEARRLSITTIPRVYESLWLPDGEKLIIRYLKDDNESIETFSVKINPATTTLNEFEGGVDGNHLPEDIGTIAVSPSGAKIFYMTNNLNGSSGYTAKPDGLGNVLLFQSSLIEWIASWPKEETLALNTKASANIPGFLYFVNTKTGIFTRVIGNINGLTSKTSSSTNKVLYSDSSRGVPRLYLFDVKKGESKLLPWNTLPEKCVWSNTDESIVYCAVPKSFSAGNYPDAWYQGLASFTDDIWMINTETMASTLLMDIARETNNEIDVIEPQIDINDNYLLFTNKKDLTLWSLQLK